MRLLIASVGAPALGVTTLTSAINAAQRPFTLSACEVRALGDGKAVVRDGVLGPEIAHALASAVCALDNNLFMPFGTGRRDLRDQSDLRRLAGIAGQQPPRMRGDFCTWFDDQGRLSSGVAADREEIASEPAPMLALLHSFFETVSHDLNQQCFLSLRSQDCQLARYPADGISHYPRHVDALQDNSATRGARSLYLNPSLLLSPRRVITCIYYLNEGWTNEHGGELRIWDAADVATERYGQISPASLDIAPVLDRLVMFRSDVVPHAVLPSHRSPRHAATAWFY